MILIYVTCKDLNEAKKISKILLTKNLCACVNIFPQMRSMYKWPSGSNTIEESEEVVLIIKTLRNKFDRVSKQIKELHEYDTPAIFSIGVDEVDEKYLEWIKTEMIE